MNMLEMIKSIKNPKMYVMNMMKQNSNPVFSQLIDMANNGKNQELETFARNFCKSRNIDFDKEFNEIKNVLK